MPDEPTVSEHQIRYSTDMASVQQSLGAVESIKDGYKGMGAAVDSATSGLDTAGQRVLSLRQEVKDLADDQRRLERAWLAGENVTQQFTAATVLLEKKRYELAQAERDLREEIAGTSEEMRQQVAESKRLADQRAEWERASLYGDVESSGRAITGAIGFIGGEAGAGVERSLNVGAELLATAEAAGRLKQQLPAMTSNLIASAGGAANLAVAAGAAAAAAVGVVVFWKQAKAIVDESAEGTRTFIEVNKQLADVLATGTSQAAREVIAENEERVKALERESVLLQQFVDTAETMGGVEGALLDVNDALGLNLGGYEDVVDRLKAVNGELQTSYDVNYQLELALRDGAFAANDMAAAERALADMRAAVLDDEIALWNQFATASEEQVDAEIRRQQVLLESAQYGEENARLQGQSAEEIQKYIDAQDRATASIAYLNDPIRRMAQANDVAREAVEIHTDAIDRRTQSDRDAARLSSEAVEQELQSIVIRRDAINSQIESLRAMAGDNQEAADAVKALEDELATLSTREAQLTEVIRPQVEAREAEIETIENAQKALEILMDYREDELEAAREATEDAQEAFDKRAELQKEFKNESIALETERERDILEEQADFARQRLRDIRDFNLDLADLDQDYLDKRGDLVDAVGEAQTDANKAQVETIRDHQKEDLRLLKEHKQRLLEIEENAERAIEDAAATLNSAGVIAAKEQGERSLKSERDRYEQARIERDEDFQDLLAQLKLEGQAKVDAARDAVAELDRQHQKERIKRQEAFARQLTDEDEDRRVSLQRQRDAWKREDEERRDHLNEQLRELKNQQRDALVAARQHYGHLRTATAEGMGRVRDAFTRGLDSLVVSVTRTLTGSTTPAKGYAGGGTPPLGQDVWVGEDGTEWATVGRSTVLLGQGGAERVRFMAPARVYPHGQQPPAVQVNMPVTVEAGGEMSATRLQVLLERHLPGMVARSIIAITNGETAGASG